MPTNPAARPRRAAGSTIEATRWRGDPDRRAAQAHGHQGDGERRTVVGHRREEEAGRRQAQPAADQLPQRQAGRHRGDHDRPEEVCADVRRAQQAGRPVRPAEQVVADRRQQDAVGEPPERLGHAGGRHDLGEHDDRGDRPLARHEVRWSRGRGGRPAGHAVVELPRRQLLSKPLTVR